MSRLAAVVFAGASLLLHLGALVRADVFRWDNQQLIPGTEGIEPGPGVQLNNRNLTFADLANRMLTGANFQSSNLRDARFDLSVLTNANFTGTNIERASFKDTTSRGFTRQQLYSTASYVQKNLRQINLAENDLSGWNFTSQVMNSANLQNANLSDAFLNGADLTAANLRGANLTHSQLTRATLRDADFEGAIVEVAFLSDITSRGFTKVQLYSTASYQDQTLTFMSLINNDMTGWDFTGQDLTQTHLDDSILSAANFSGANLTNAYFNGGTLTGADFSNAIVNGTAFWHTNLTEDQLYSTRSYQTKDLQRIGLVAVDLTGWDFRGHNLTNAKLNFSTLKDVDFTGAEVEGASFSTTTIPGRDFTKEQLYSTASYQRKSLRGVNLVGNNLDGWDFSGQDLTRAVFGGAPVDGANFTGATISGAFFQGLSGQSSLSKEQLYTTASYQQRDLRGIAITLSDLAGWDFRGQDLRNANFEVTRPSTATFALTDLRSAIGFFPEPSTDMRNAIRPDGAIEGLSLQADDTLVVRDFAVNALVHNTFSMADSSVLELGLGNRGGGAMMSLSAEVVPELGGTLRLAFGPDTDFADISGATIDLFDWPAVLAAGNEFDRIETPLGSQWDLSQLYITGEVTLQTIPEPSGFFLLAIAALGVATSVMSQRRQARPLRQGRR